MRHPQTQSPPEKRVKGRASPTPTSRYSSCFFCNPRKTRRIFCVSCVSRVSFVSPIPARLSVGKFAQTWSCSWRFLSLVSEGSLFSAQHTRCLRHGLAKRWRTIHVQTPRRGVSTSGARRPLHPLESEDI